MYLMRNDPLLSESPSCCRDSFLASAGEELGHNLVQVIAVEVLAWLVSVPNQVAFPIHVEIVMLLSSLVRLDKNTTIAVVDEVGLHLLLMFHDILLSFGRHYAYKFVITI